jgi:predicted DNA-binding protein
MRRKQIYLDEANERALKRLAARTGRSEASLIREALKRYLTPGGEHDHYLYGAPKERA